MCTYGVSFLGSILYHLSNQGSPKLYIYTHIPVCTYTYGSNLLNYSDFSSYSFSSDINHYFPRIIAPRTNCKGPQNNQIHISSVAQSCPTLCDPMNHSTPGLPIHHQLPEFTQTQVHRIGDDIQPSHHSFWSYFSADLQ